MEDAKKQTYSLPFRGLPEGNHKFDYHLGNDFMKAYDTLSEYLGDLEATVVLVKQDSKQLLELNLFGKVETTCDRCLETMVLEFSAEGKYYLREGEEGEEEKEDVVFVAKDEQELELSQLFYEMIMLNLPQKKMHDEEDCSEEMLGRIEGLQEKEIEIDPRWAELEKLIKKENK